MKEREREREMYRESGRERKMKENVFAILKLVYVYQNQISELLGAKNIHNIKAEQV